MEENDFISISKLNNNTTNTPSKNIKNKNKSNFENPNSISSPETIKSPNHIRSNKKVAFTSSDHLKQKENKKLLKKPLRSSNYKRALSLNPGIQDEDIIKLEEDLEKAYNEYSLTREKVFPGNKTLNDNYCKLTTLLDNDCINFKSPSEQNLHIEEILKLYDQPGEKPKLFNLYADNLHFNILDKLKYRNNPSEVKELFRNFFILKYFKLMNKREKIISKANHIIHFNGLDEKFIINKDYKIGKINTEIDLTLKRILRLTNVDEKRTKDYEYYLKHFKLKKLDTVFLKSGQTDFHSHLRRDDFEVYFRENCYNERINYYLKNFEPYIKFVKLNAAVEIWKKSKIIGNDFQQKNYNEQINRIKQIFAHEKAKWDPADLKIFKEYFKEKYKFYYELKDKMDDKHKKILSSFEYDIIFPPLVISMNAEISHYIKELCEYFQIQFDISIDKGKAFSYSIDIFFPNYFKQQIKNFTYLPYELTLNEMDSNDNDLQDIGEELKITEVLRNTYNNSDGFLVNNVDKLGKVIRNPLINRVNYVKKATWVKYICVSPTIDQNYSSLQKKLNQLGYVDSLFKYEMELIEVADYNLMMRLIDDYILNISSRIRNTIKLTKHKEFNELNSLKDIVKGIVGETIKNELEGCNLPDEYVDKVDTDLLKYFLILRFLKLRDLKFYILNLLNYFRYVQKKFAIDIFKIENSNLKKSNDFQNMGDILLNTIKFQENKKQFDIKDLISQLPISEYSKTNPIIPPMEYILQGKKEFEDFPRILLNEINETLEYSEKVIRIKDSKGNFIIYDATFSDMKQLELDFEKIGTHYINKHEILLINSNKTPNPTIDRSQVILDFFTYEFEFLYSKYELVSDLMTIYENTCDVFTSKSLMQLIVDIMSKRPNLDLSYNYFTTGYMIEIEVIKKKAALIHTLIDYQKKVEFNENKLLHDTVEKTYWILGEVAADIIKHIRIDKKEIETLKKMISEKDKQSKNEELTLMENLLEIFENLSEEKDHDSLKINKLIKESQEAQEKSSMNKNQLENDQPEITNINEKIIEKDESSKKLIMKFKILIIYLKRIFANTLTNNTNYILENSPNDLLNTDNDETKDIKELINLSIQNLDKSSISSSQKGETLSHRTYSVYNSSLELINYKIRSILNIPNPINEQNFLKVLEKNPSLVNNLNKEINFIRFEEGFPDKFHENEENIYIPHIEYCQGLSNILPIIQMIDNSFNEMSKMFDFESFVSQKLLEVSFLDHLIEEWDKYKEFISGRVKNAEFDKIYHFQETILDNYQLLIYSIKLLVATLGNNLSSIPPSILVKLPLKKIDNIDFENYNFEVLDYNSSSKNIESIVLNDLNLALVETLNDGMKKEFLNLNNELELQIYCNAVEVFHTKMLLTRLSSLTTVLTREYEIQKKIILNRPDNIIYFKDSMNFHLNPRNNMYIDYTITSNSLLNSNSPKFPIYEYDPTFQNCIDFHNLLNTQTNYLDKGLEELKSFLHYEYMHYYLLLIGTQNNSNVMFEPSKYLAEIELVENFKIISYHRLFDSSIITSNENMDNLKIYNLKIRTNGYISSIGREMFYYILDKKSKGRDTVLQKLNTFKESINYINKTKMVKNIYIRFYRYLLLNAYIKDILFEIYLDSIKIQACDTAQALRKLITIIPKEFNVIDINHFDFMNPEKSDHQNIQFFIDNSKPFNSFSIPSVIDILRMENKSDLETIVYYRKYNPFKFIEDISYIDFFDQLRDNFFNSPSLINKLENYRNFFFEEAYDFQSNVLLLLQISNFFLNTINFKLMEISLTQKSTELINLYEANDKGIDFWGDKNVNSQNKSNKDDKLPIVIIDQIIQNQQNFVNLRLVFEKFQNSFSSILENIKLSLNHATPHLSVKKYLHSTQYLQIIFLINIYQRGREASLASGDIVSAKILSSVLDKFQGVAYYRNNNCKLPTHISHRVLKLFKRNEYNLYNFNYNYLGLDIYMKKHLHLYNDKGTLLIEDLFSPINNFHQKEEHIFFINNFNDFLPLKYEIMNLSDKRTGELRNLSFKLHNNLEKYMIYLEISKLNNEITEINNKKIRFLEYYLKVVDNKLKFLILYFKKYIPIDPLKYNKMLKIIKPLFKKIPDDFEDLDKITESYIRCDRVSELNHLFRDQKALTGDKTNDEERLKMDNSVIIESFIHLIHNLFEIYRRETKIDFMNNSISYLKKQKLAIVDAVNNSKNDVSIVKFKNQFSSCFYKDLDEANVTNINKKFSFFEVFVNRIINIAIECDTHSNNTALLIMKNEWEESVSNMIREFLIYETNKLRSEKILYCSEKFGNYLTMRKLELRNEFITKRIKDYDSNFEKISNAKLALTGNKLVFEMDNLYRQLKLLKDNVLIIEDYMKKYFEDLFKNKINKLNVEKEETEAKFINYKNELVSEVVQDIADEYKSNLDVIKNQNMFLTEIIQADLKRREEDVMQQDIFYKEIEVEKKFLVLLNAERKKNEKLTKNIANLHSFYRFKLHLQQVKNNKQIEEFKNVLSSNQDLWDKLGISEKNEHILKEELSKTQKTLAATEELIKRLQQQVRKCHDKNVDLEKQLSNLAAQKIIQNAGNNEKVKTKELYQESKQMYIYNLKDNYNIINSIEKIKTKYKDDKDIKLLLENFDLIQNKYTQEVENKRKYITMLNKIKDDIADMKSQECLKFKELEDKYNQAVEELNKLKNANNNVLRRDKSMKSFRGSLDLDYSNREVNSINLKEKNMIMSRIGSSLKHNFSVDKFVLKKTDQTFQFSNDDPKKKLIGLKKNLNLKGLETKLNFRVLGKNIMDVDRDII